MIAKLSGLLLLSAPLAAGEILLQESSRFDVFGLQFSARGEQLATVGSSGRVAIWDMSSGRLLDLSSEQTGGENELSFSGDNRYLAHRSRGGSFVRNWIDRRTIWASEQSGLLDVDAAAKKFFITKRNAIEVRSLESGEAIGEIPLPGRDIRFGAVDGKNTLLLLCAVTGILRVDVEKKSIVSVIDVGFPGQPLQPGSTAEAPIYRGLVLWKPDAIRRHALVTVLSGAERTWTKYFDLNSAGPGNELPPGITSSNSEWLGSSGKVLHCMGGMMKIADPVTGESTNTSASLPADTRIDRIAVDDTGRRVAIGTEKGWLRFDGEPGDPDSWKEHIYPEFPRSVMPYRLSPDGRTMAVIGLDGVLSEIPVDGSEAVKQPGIVKKEPHSMEWFGDGTLFCNYQTSVTLVKAGGEPHRLPDLVAGDVDPCGDFMIVTSPQPARLWVIDSSGSTKDQLPLPEDPTIAIHANREASCFAFTTRLNDSTSFTVSRLDDAGKISSTRTFDTPGNSALVAVDKKGNLLVWDRGGVLSRIDTNSGTKTLVRETGEQRWPLQFQFSPSEDHLIVSGESLPTPAVVPLAADRKVVALDFSHAESVKLQVGWLGFTAKGNYVWTTLNSGAAQLHDLESGKVVARARFYEDGLMAAAVSGNGGFALPAASERLTRRPSGTLKVLPAESDSKAAALLKRWHSKN